MKYIDKKLGEELEINNILIPIFKKNIKKYPYCKLKKRQCFETYQHKCLNYTELEEIDNDKNE